MLTRIVSTDKTLSDIYFNMEQVMEVLMPNSDECYIHIKLCNGYVESSRMINRTYRKSIEKAIKEFNNGPTQELS